MYAVLFVYKIIETILGMFCLGFHMSGFLKVAVAQDFYVYCGIFAGFTLLAMFGCINIAVGIPPSLRSELFVALLAAISYMFSSLSAMYHAEKDFYLMYLSDFEEPLHPFFRYSKAQSIASLVCCTMYMMHAIFIYDVLSYDEDKYFDSDDDISVSAINPQLYLFSKTVQAKLERYAWFRQINGVPASLAGLQTV